MALGPLPTFLGPDGADVRRGGVEAVGTGERGGGPQTRRAGASHCPDHLQQTARKSIKKMVLA